MKCNQWSALSLLRSLSKLLNGKVDFQSIEEAVVLAQSLNALLLSDENEHITIGTKTDIIFELAKFLSHHSVRLVQFLSTVFVQCMHEDVRANKDVSLHLIEQAHLSLLGIRDLADERLPAVLELLTNLVVDNEQNQKLLHYSGCFMRILKMMNYWDYKELKTIHSINSFVNVIMAATCIPINNRNKLQAVKEVVPMVLNFMKFWLHNPSPSTTIDVALTDALFLCRHLLLCSGECQNVFIEHRGLHILKRVLQDKNLMLKNMEVKEKPRKLKSAYSFDHSTTLFASFVKLFDDSIIHNSTACFIAADLKMVDVLKSFLDMAPPNQIGCVISCLVHLFEGLNINDSNLVNIMSNIMQRGEVDPLSISLPVKNYLLMKNTMETRSKRNKCSWKGTPHPRKFIQSHVKKDPITSKPPSPKSLVAVVPHCSSKSSVHIKAGASKSSLVQKKESMPKFTRHFINNAEILILLKCIKIYGLNMQVVRRMYPFHTMLTASDLYALWRLGIWKKKLGCQSQAKFLFR